MKHAETTLAKNIRLTQEKAVYDASCKRLLAQKIILAHIMKACLPEYWGLDAEEIAEKYIEGTPQIAKMPVLPDEENEPVIRGVSTEDKSPNEGTVTYDIRFYAAAPGSQGRIGLILNVEAQSDFYPGYPLVKRGIYYCCRMVSAQYGTEFTGSHYEKLKKVYSIWICMDPPKHRQNTVIGYHMEEQALIGTPQESRENYDLLSVLLICLGEPEGAESQSVLRMLDVLFSMELRASEKKQILEREFGLPMEEAEEKEAASMHVVEKMYLKGVDKGMQEGVQEGILSSIRSLMKTMNLTGEQAMNALDIPEEDREVFRTMLRK